MKAPGIRQSLFLAWTQTTIERENWLQLPPGQGYLEAMIPFLFLTTSIVSTAVAAAPIPGIQLPVKIMAQTTDYTCGVVCLNSVLDYLGKPVWGELHLARFLGTTEKEGTHPEQIRDGVERMGLKADLRQGLSIKDLEQALKRGHPVLVLIRFSDGVNGHWVVVNGIQSQQITMMDPDLEARERRYRYESFQNFNRDWWHSFDEGKTIYRGVGIEIYP
ncbi:MAG: hypothetical protein COT73_12720 [Bdellovibrio sp. CG10_big_fil_rev_8_21_14_0_10_47_8]|nr:MAG: hypothetical protein COT73_12720 [Bdellovibrio sp. CG10_big_fil_rev_8_21_14_0_10_47_8]